jgi:hypothetical protein
MRGSNPLDIVLSSATWRIGTEAKEKLTNSQTTSLDLELPANTQQPRQPDIFGASRASPSTIAAATSAMEVTLA